MHLMPTLMERQLDARRRPAAAARPWTARGMTFSLHGQTEEILGTSDGPRAGVQLEDGRVCLPIWW